ncbi:metal ABC transporter permease [Corynebacterium sp. H127]|uniref:metal ABC transporter permease n=1 Tax=Corynebacterium sp. H127 TaxID=3133418 RepID=UPI0030B4E7CF
MIPVFPLVEALSVGAAAGLVGAVAVLHRRVFFSEAITHATFPGAVLGVVLAAAFVPGISASGLSVFLFLGAFAACIPLAGMMRVLEVHAGLSAQAAAGVVLTLGFSGGYFLAKWFQPLPLRVDSFLTGSILTVNALDIAAATGLLLIAGAVVWALRWPLVYTAFDRNFPGQRTALFDAIVLILICLTVVVCIPAVGTILPIALIAAPAGTLWTTAKDPLWFLAGSAVLGATLAVFGLTIAVGLSLSAGGMIALAGGCCFALSGLWRRSGLLQ